MVSFAEYMSQRVPLSEDERKAVDELLPQVAFPKSHFLLKEGQVSDAFFYLHRGCVRMFYDVDGQEKSAFFYTEGQFVSSYESYVKQVPSDHFLQCVEDCQISIVTFQAAEKLLALSPKFDAFARIVMEEELSLYQRMMASFITKNPEARYQQFQTEHPELLQRLPQHYIASYLGVSAETLSRIRRRLLDREKMD